MISASAVSIAVFFHGRGRELSTAQTLCTSAIMIVAKHFSLRAFVLITETDTHTAATALLISAKAEEEEEEEEYTISFDNCVITEVT